MTIKYAKAKAKRAELWLVNYSNRIAWQPGNPIRIYRSINAAAIVKGQI